MRDLNKQSSQTTSKRKKFAEESDESSDSEPSTQQPITQSASQSASNVLRLNIMRQSACLVFNPITVDNYAAFFNCTPVGRASDSMMAPTSSYSF